MCFPIMIIQDGPIAFDKEEVAKCLSHIKPLVAGVVNFASLLKGMHAAAGLTIDADKFVERCKTDESIKAKLRENTEEVITRGGFGSPW